MLVPLAPEGAWAEVLQIVKDAGVPEFQYKLISTPLGSRTPRASRVDPALFDALTFSAAKPQIPVAPSATDLLMAAMMEVAPVAAAAAVAVAEASAAVSAAVAAVAVPASSDEVEPVAMAELDVVEMPEPVAKVEPDVMEMPEPDVEVAMEAEAEVMPVAAALAVDAAAASMAEEVQVEPTFLAAPTDEPGEEEAADDAPAGTPPPSPPQSQDAPAPAAGKRLARTPPPSRPPSQPQLHIACAAAPPAAAAEPRPPTAGAARVTSAVQRTSVPLASPRVPAAAAPTGAVQKRASQPAPVSAAGGKAGRPGAARGGWGSAVGAGAAEGAASAAGEKLSWSTVTELLAILNNMDSDLWQRRADALVALRLQLERDTLQLAAGSPTLPKLAKTVAVQVSDLRSQIVVAACAFIRAAAAKMGGALPTSVVDMWLVALLNNTFVTIKIINTSSRDAASDLIQRTHALGSLPLLAKTVCTDKHAAARRASAELLLELLRLCSADELLPHGSALEDAICSGLADADAATRPASGKLYWDYLVLFADRTAAVAGRLDTAQQKIVARARPQR
ncbi:clasp N terminal-domain-containing protein [Pavlovales sp. CCMP2436]|nr:clasp N terminal-domain-containing protein [Pavlovales sp. CCMP2436]